MERIPRTGFEPVTLIVVVVVLLLVAAFVISVFSSDFLEFGKNQDERANSTEINLCRNNVETWCLSNSEEDWSDVYSHCVQYADVIQGTDTTCPETIFVGGGSSGGSGGDSGGSGDGSGGDSGGSDGGGDEPATCADAGGVCTTDSVSAGMLCTEVRDDLCGAGESCCIGSSVTCSGLGGVCYSTGSWPVGGCDQTRGDLCGDSQFCCVNPVSSCGEIGGVCAGEPLPDDTSICVGDDEDDTNDENLFPNNYCTSTEDCCLRP